MKRPGSLPEVTWQIAVSSEYPCAWTYTFAVSSADVFSVSFAAEPIQMKTVVKQSSR